jgi:hypothetical protein
MRSFGDVYTYLGNTVPVLLRIKEDKQKYLISKKYILISAARGSTSSLASEQR